MYSTPKFENETPEEAWAFYQRIANRQTLEDVCNTEKIEQAVLRGDEKSIKSWHFTALYAMISYGAMDFYPELQKKKQELLQKTEEYISLMRQLAN